MDFQEFKLPKDSGERDRILYMMFSSQYRPEEQATGLNVLRAIKNLRNRDERVGWRSIHREVDSYSAERKISMSTIGKYLKLFEREGIIKNENPEGHQHNYNITDDYSWIASLL